MLVSKAVKKDSPSFYLAAFVEEYLLPRIVGVVEIDVSNLLLAKVIDKVLCVASKMLPPIAPSAPTPRIRKIPKITIP